MTPFAAIHLDSSAWRKHRALGSLGGGTLYFELAASEVEAGVEEECVDGGEVAGPVPLSTLSIFVARPPNTLTVAAFSTFVSRREIGSEEEEDEEERME